VWVARKIAFLVSLWALGLRHLPGFVFCFASWTFFAPDFNEKVQGKEMCGFDGFHFPIPAPCLPPFPILSWPN